MNTPRLHVGIKNNVTGDMNDGVCELYYLDRIQNKECFDWDSMQVEEQSLLADVISQVKYYNPRKIIQHIDSGGGSADVGFGIYNYTKNVGCKVETKILNMCGSIATVIAFAGDKGKITMPRNGLYVIHQASNIGVGTSKEIREAADLADKYTEMMLDVYVQNNRKGMTRDEIYALIKDGDHWMTGAEAKEMGFVDDTYNDEAITVTASINAARGIYGNIPQRILDMAEKVPEVTADVEPETQHKTLIDHFMDLKKLVTAAIDGIRGAKVDTKSTDITADIAAALATPLTEMMDGVTAAINTEREEMKTQVTADITTSLTTTLTESLTAHFNPIIEGYKNDIANLTAELTALKGKGSSGQGKSNEQDTNTRSLIGKFAGEE